MTKQYDTWTDEITVEVYMADANPPAFYDFFLSRSGALRRAPASVPVGGLMQVVLAGPSPPSKRQLLALKRNFGFESRLRLLTFF